MGFFSTLDDILKGAWGSDYAERAVEKVKETKDLLVGTAKSTMTTYSNRQANMSQNNAVQDSHKIKKALDAFDE